MTLTPEPGPSARAPRRRRGPAPIVAAVTLAGLGLCAWRAFVQPALPPRRELFDPVPERFIDVEGAQAPLYLRGDAARDGLLILGDSRARAALALRVLERGGVRPVGLLWNGLAQFDHLLQGARDLPPRRLLICLSPASVHDRPRPHMQARLAEERAKRLTARVDERLDAAVDGLRKRLVRPIQLAHFRGGTLERELDPRAQVGIYRALLGRDTRAARRRKLQTLGAELRELQREGWRIACVRLPISPPLLAVEERSLRAQRFEELCDALHLPYLDLSGERYLSFDGSHLVAEEAPRVSARVASWLTGLPEFLEPADG